MIIDIAIILFVIGALYRGRELGFVRQLFATIGFFGGLFLGAWLQPYLTQYIQEPVTKAVGAAAIALSAAITLLMIGEHLGIRLKQALAIHQLDRFDKLFGGFLNGVSLLISVWLTAAIVTSLPFPQIKYELQSSRIIGGLNNVLPSAPSLLADLGKLITPNGFPQVFLGHEPAPPDSINLPSLSEIRPAVDKDRPSIIKIEGQGCGGVVDGSGFVAGQGFVVTNAHVVAGIRQPYVEDENGIHKGMPVWFDPDLDIAVLRVQGLAGQPLYISSSVAAQGAGGAVLGYPGGGGFTADPATVIDAIIARGRNIYGTNVTTRQVYEIHGAVVPGNSGGPLIDKKGDVIGVVFAQSTNYDSVGYALTAPPVAKAVQQAVSRNAPVSTSACSEE